MGVLSLAPPPALVLNANELNSWLKQLLEALAQSNKDMYSPHSHRGPVSPQVQRNASMLGPSSRQGCCENSL